MVSFLKDVGIFAQSFDRIYEFGMVCDLLKCVNLFTI